MLQSPHQRCYIAVNSPGSMNAELGGAVVPCPHPQRDFRAPKAVYVKAPLCLRCTGLFAWTALAPPRNLPRVRHERRRHGFGKGGGLSRKVLPPSCRPSSTVSSPHPGGGHFGLQLFCLSARKQRYGLLDVLRARERRRFILPVLVLVLILYKDCVTTKRISDWNSLIFSLSVLVNFSEIPVIHFTSLHFTCTYTYCNFISLHFTNISYEMCLLHFTSLKCQFL